MRMRLLHTLPLLLPIVAQAQTVGQIGQREATPNKTAASTVNATDGSGIRLSAPVMVAVNADGSAIAGGSGGGGAVADQFTSGTLALGTAGSIISVPIVAGQNAVTVSIIGLTGTGATVIDEGNSGGSVNTLFAPMLALSAQTGVLTSTWTSDSSFTLNTAGRTSVQLRVTVAAGTASNATVTFNRSVAVRDVGIDKPLPPGSNTIGGVSVTNQFYTLATAATASAPQSPIAGSYVLNLPSAFNGATGTATFTSSNGNVSTASYTALPASPPRFDVYAGTTISFAWTGGTPTGNTTLSGGPTSGAGGIQQINIGAISYTDRSITLTAAQAGGTAMIIAANSSRKAFAITPAADGRLYLNSGGTGFYYPLYAGVTRSFSGQDCPTNALYVTGQTAGSTLPMAEG